MGGRQIVLVSTSGFFSVLNKGIFWRDAKTKKVFLQCVEAEGQAYFMQSMLPTLQRQNADNLKQIFPEKEYRGLSPNFHIHVSLSELYKFSRWVCLFCWRKYVDRSWEYINRSQTHECGNWGWGRAIPRKGIYNRNCRCSAVGCAVDLAISCYICWTFLALFCFELLAFE